MSTVTKTNVTAFDGAYYADVKLRDGRWLTYQRAFRKRDKAREFAQHHRGYDLADLDYGLWFFVDKNEVA